MGIHGTGAAFMGYLAGGPFSESEKYGQIALSIRTSFVALSYGILVCHFIYRYVVLHNARLVEKTSSPFGMFCIFIFVLLHGVAWTMIVELYLYGDDETKEYVREDFLISYKVDSSEVSMLSGIYYGASPSMIRRSWTGVTLLTIFTFYALSVYFILGYKIMRKLRCQSTISQQTANLHRHLFKALTVQTFIPIVISFSPCCIAWYAPMFGINVGIWNNFFGVVALSAFPTLDPIAIIYLLPKYRMRVLVLLKVQKVTTIKSVLTNESNSVPILNQRKF